jgi:hypothetical protein
MQLFHCDCHQITSMTIRGRGLDALEPVSIKEEVPPCLPTAIAEPAQFPADRVLAQTADTTFPSRLDDPARVSSRGGSHETGRSR